MLRNLDITFAMSFAASFMLWACRSVLITSGLKPCFMAGTACRQVNAPPPSRWTKAAVLTISAPGSMYGLKHAKRGMPLRIIDIIQCGDDMASRRRRMLSRNGVMIPARRPTRNCRARRSSAIPTD